MPPPPDNYVIRITREVVYLSMVNKTVAWISLVLATALFFFANLVSRLMAVAQVTVAQTPLVSSGPNKIRFILESAYRVLRWGSSHVQTHHSGMHMSLPCPSALKGLGSPQPVAI